MVRLVVAVITVGGCHGGCGASGSPARRREPLGPRRAQACRMRRRSQLSVLQRALTCDPHCVSRDASAGRSEICAVAAGSGTSWSLAYRSPPKSEGSYCRWCHTALSTHVHSCHDVRLGARVVGWYLVEPRTKGQSLSLQWAWDSVAGHRAPHRTIVGQALRYRYLPRVRPHTDSHTRSVAFWRLSGGLACSIR